MYSKHVMRQTRESDARVFREGSSTFLETTRSGQCWEEGLDPLSPSINARPLDLGYIHPLSPDRPRGLHNTSESDLRADLIVKEQVELLDIIHRSRDPHALQFEIFWLIAGTGRGPLDRRPHSRLSNKDPTYWMA